MLYLILFLSSIVIIADLVTLVKYFVAGEITIRFILKVAITLIIALLVGLYYILELKKRKNLYKMGIIFGSVGLVLFLTAIIWSFMVMGSPAKQRLLRLDDRRIQDLQNIQWQVINYWQRKEKLPDDLKDLKDPLSGYSLPVDPDFEKGKVYEYYRSEPTKNLKFELCATFSLSMPKGWQEYQNYYGKGGIMPMATEDMAISETTSNMIYPYPVPGGTNESWDHEVGRTCFERTIDPELYPPFKNQL